MASPNSAPTSSCHVVAVPYPGRGNINAMLDLCTAMVEKTADANCFSITVILTEEWLGLIGSATKLWNIQFTTIPNILPSERVRGADQEGFFQSVQNKMQEPVQWLLDQLSIPPVVLIADACLPWAADVAAQINIPLASLWPMPASVFSLNYHLDLLEQNGHFPVNLPVNGDEVVDYIPGLLPLRVADLPTPMTNQEFAEDIAKLIPKANFLIFCSIYELERQVIDALKQTTPYSIYNIGPASSYLQIQNHISSNTIPIHEQDEYLKWLDCQPPSSVLYISLGSFLSVSKPPMDEIAAGIRESGVQFLWVARGDTSGLVEICGDNGLIVQWCDQLRVLCHPSVGGFWSHCGWNSTKEALLVGMPVLAFPILAEQPTNAKAIVDDWKVGWRVKRESDEDLAKCHEVAKLVAKFMDMENPERKELTENAKKLQKICATEFADRKSFQANLNDFTKSILLLGSSEL